MLKFLDEELTGIREFDECIKDLINERMIREVHIHISIVKDTENPDKNYMEHIFPKNYPVEKRLERLEKLREKLTAREYVKLNTIDKYCLANIIFIAMVTYNIGYGTSREPFKNREKLNRILFDNFGTLKDKKKYLVYYEDFENYLYMIFEDIDFMSIEDESVECLMNIEMIENEGN